MNVALLQIAAGENLQHTQAKGAAFCREAKARGADIALFPEMFSNGYRIYGRPVSDWVKDAIPADHPFVSSYQHLARELGMAIGITFLETCETGPKNSLILFDRFGRKALHYSKVHTCDFDIERNLTPGEGFSVADLDTQDGSVKVGAMICYDREFPESARILMLQGAELLLVPNACPMELNRLSQLRARAYENMLAIATCNYPSSVPDCNGHSTIFDGVAYLPDEAGSRDMCVLEAGTEEGLWMAELDLNLLRHYRCQEVHGNAYRHPRKYGLLCSDERREPFLRDDYRP